MYEKPLEEKLDELISLVRALDTKINFLQEDITEIKTAIEDLPMIKACVEQLAYEQLQNIQQKEAKRWKVERL
jgi:prefoldin subunit 5